MAISLLSRHKSNIISLAWLLIVVLSISNMIIFVNCIKKWCAIRSGLNTKVCITLRKISNHGNALWMMVMQTLYIVNPNYNKKESMVMQIV